MNVARLALLELSYGELDQALSTIVRRYASPSNLSSMPFIVPIQFLALGLLACVIFFIRETCNLQNGVEL